MRIIFLGTGTSVGIPVIGCSCRVCSSDDPRNRRRRTSLYITTGDTHIVVDTPPDFREQVLEFGVPHVDAVLFTHSHADHVFGFDDIRRFNTIQDCVIPAFGLKETMDDMRRIFNYAENTVKTPGLYRPRIEFREIAGPFEVGDVHVKPLPVMHEPIPTLGYHFEAGGRTLAYVPDCSSMPEESVSILRGVDVMILDALRHRPHKTHLTVEDSVKLLQRINAGRSFIVHMCHDLDHEETRKALPEGIEVSYDGLTLEW